MAFESRAPPARTGPASAVAGAGDVNGDGLDNILVGADLADNNGRSDSGSAYVVFGRRAADNVDLADLGEAGFRIDGAASSDEAGASVAAAGDMNGDGLYDLLVDRGPRGRAPLFGGRHLRRVRPGDVHERGSRRPRGGRLPDERVRNRR